MIYINVSEDDLPKHDDILEEGEEDKDNAATHPNIQSRDIADPGSVLPDSPEHGGQGEEGGHGHGHSARDGLRGEEEGEPGNNHKQTLICAEVKKTCRFLFYLKEGKFEANGSLFFS
jgi:hypothetical protein